MTAPLSLFCNECGAANTLQAACCFACGQSLERPAVLPPAHHALPVPSAAPSSASPSPGSLLHERYKLVREIGQGGFGVVYLAEDCRRYNRQVAVKQINIGSHSLS